MPDQTDPFLNPSREAHRADAALPSSAGLVGSDHPAMAGQMLAGATGRDTPAMVTQAPVPRRGVSDRASSHNALHRPPRTPESRSPVNVLLFGAAAALLLLILYGPSLSGPFVLDDKSNIENSPAIRMSELAPENLARAVKESHVTTRPVANLTFALNYLFHGYETTGYHFFNLLIHLSAGLFLFLWFRELLNLPAVRRRYGAPGLVPAAAALLWLVHPLQIQAVTYIVQRMTSMSAMFFILALFCYVRGRQADGLKARLAWFFCTISAALLSLGSKEIAVTLPFFIFLHEWYFFQNLDTAWLRRRLPLGALLAAGLLGLVFFYLGERPIHHINDTYLSRDFTLPERLLTEPRVVLFYLSLVFFPNPGRLNLEHDFLLSRSLFDHPSTFLAVLLLVGLFTTAILQARRNPLLSFAVFWYLGNLVLESSVIGLEIAFQHRAYLPAMPIFPLAVLFVRRHADQPAFRMIPLVIILALLSLWTYDRNSVWADDVTLWSDCVRKSPAKARPRVNLGIALKNRGRLREAVEQYRTAVRLAPDYPEAYYNLGNALLIQGHYKRAAAAFTQSLRLNPHDMDSHYHLGYIFGKLGQYRQAIRHYTEALRLQPDFTAAERELTGLRRFLQARPAGSL